MMAWFRKTAPVATRKPHPDPRVEAQLQYILSLYAAVSRTSQRIADITKAQKKLDGILRRNAGSSDTYTRQNQANELRDERARLEQSVRELHEQITTRLAALGDDDLYLGSL
jgi:hypothetical protein